MRWQGQGFKTHRLEQLLTDEEVADADAVLAGYEADVAELRALAETAGSFDAAAGGSARFKDPDRIAEGRAFVARLREGTTPPSAPSGALTFEGFIAGSTNDGAVKAATAVAAEPGHKFNPLFLVGAVGSGKTRASSTRSAAPSRWRGRGPSVACVSAQTFFEELVAAIHGERADWAGAGGTAARTPSLLDDVQLLAGKERTQEELFNLFNAFQDAGKQLRLQRRPAAGGPRGRGAAPRVALLRGARRRPRPPRPRDARRDAVAGSSRRRTSAPTPGPWTTSRRGPRTGRAPWPASSTAS